MTAQPDYTMPGFTRTSGAEASENERDESNIVTDQDQSAQGVPDENMGARSRTLDSLEEEPDDFIRGEIDVKEQMDRAADAMDTSLRGLQNQGTEDSPRTELGASFKHTPGGIEEVKMKTDQDLARRSHKEKNRPQSP